MAARPGAAWHRATDWQPEAPTRDSVAGHGVGPVTVPGQPGDSDSEAPTQ